MTDTETALRADIARWRAELAALPQTPDNLPRRAELRIWIAQWLQDIHAQQQAPHAGGEG